MSIGTPMPIRAIPQHGGPDRYLDPSKLTDKQRDNLRDELEKQGGYKDAQFIAHARTDVPALLAMVRERDAALERVRELAHAWESRGEHDMKFSKTIPDEDFAIALLTDGAQMVENARLIIAAITATEGA